MMEAPGNGNPSLLSVIRPVSWVRLGFCASANNANSREQTRNIFFKFSYAFAWRRRIFYGEIGFQECADNSEA
jgi:hypothetical protein